MPSPPRIGNAFDAHGRPGCLRLVALCLFLACESVTLAQSTTTQTLNLNPGWNAVWLEVEPRDADGNRLPPEVVFSNPAISTVAIYLPTQTQVEFVENPSSDSLNGEAWAVWYRIDPARRSNLREIHGHRAYLVRCATAVTLNLTGEAGFHLYRWVPDSYNLLGFGILGASGPTFAEFFGPAIETHPVRRIFRLESQRGTWVGVSPDEPMLPGAAYWIYSQGPSSYQGPFRMDFEGIDALDYGSQLTEHELLIFNEGEAPSDFLIERVHPANGLELIHLILDPDTLSSTEDATVVQFAIAGVGPRQSVIETFRITRDWSAIPEQRQLYRISSAGLGSYFWLPVSGTHPDLVATGETNANAAATGLWVGAVALNGVSGRVPADTAIADLRTEPVLAGPMARLILHVNASGEARLLKAVIFMRTRAIDPADAELVLVVHPEKIPYFEGIEQRAGRWVGKRIETTFYDLPRAVPPPDPLPPDFEPSELREKYLELLPLSGGVGPGWRCSTTENAPLVLDPWHRSNPFRHAFHPDHRSGFRITREISILFDSATSEAAQAIPDYGTEVLLGDYTETLRGLVRDSERIVVTGRIALRRISTAATLE